MFKQMYQIFNKKIFKNVLFLKQNCFFFNKIRGINWFFLMLYKIFFYLKINKLKNIFGYFFFYVLRI